ncbi:MAG: winged helix-turn-helix transcriptional regulator [Chitinophagaceae bacterium]|nr:winged helix-turn-helix transcriptional regulator [Chitinophagaceae bacterium]
MKTNLFIVTHCYSLPERPHRPSILPAPNQLPARRPLQQKALNCILPGLPGSLVQMGEFSIDLQQRIVFYAKTGIELSKKEFDLLNYLLLHKNRPLTRLQLSEHIWGNFSDDDYDSNYIDVHTKNIRKKLTVHAPADWLQTIRGIGYKIKS